MLLFHENDRFQLLPHFWIPEEKMQEKIRKENINYDKWVAEGYVTVTSGNVIDYDFVKADILHRGRLRPQNIGLRPLELFADDYRLAE